MIIHIPFSALLLIAFACVCGGASLGALFMAMAQAGRHRPMLHEKPKAIHPRRVVRHWDVDGTPDR